MEKILMTSSPEETFDCAVSFAQQIQPGLVCLRGDLGAGKTTFCQAVLSALGASGPFTSPTFTVIKQYDLPEGSLGSSLGVNHVYHIDAYRITSVDMVELGWSDMLAEADAVILLEWPEQIAEVLPEKSMGIAIEEVSETERQITFSA